MATTVEEGKAFDLTTGTFVDSPAKEEKPETDTEKQVREEKEEKAKEDEEAKKLEEKKKEDEKKETPEQKAEREAKEAEDKKPDTSYLKKFEKYGVASDEDIEAALSKTQELADELEKEKKTEKKVVYKSEKEEKIANFLKDYDFDKLGDGIETAAVLMRMDPDKINERQALEEAYILNNTDLTRDEAKKLFNSEYKKKYELNKEKFDGNDEEFEEAQDLANIQKKKEVAQARKLLSTEKEKLKYVEKKEEKKEEKKIEVPKESIDSYTKDIEKFFKNEKGEKFDRFTFEDEKDPSINYSIVFTPDQIKEAKEVAMAHIKRVENYDAKGKIANFDPAGLTSQILYALYGDYIADEHFKQVVTLAKTLKAEQLAGIKPSKESKGGGKAGIPSIVEQLAEMGKKEEEKRKTQKR